MKQLRFKQRTGAAAQHKHCFLSSGSFAKLVSKEPKAFSEMGATVGQQQSGWNGLPLLSQQKLSQGPGQKGKKHPGKHTETLPGTSLSRGSANLSTKHKLLHAVLQHGLEPSMNCGFTHMTCVWRTMQQMSVLPSLSPS